MFCDDRRLPIDEFFKHEKTLACDVLLLQEWPPSDGSVLNNETNKWLKSKLKEKGFTAHETQSGKSGKIEGSCIATRDSVQVSEIELDKNVPGIYSWCGIAGRTWSVVQLKPANAEPFLCFNVHAPSRADGKYKDLSDNLKQVEGPMAEQMKAFFQVQGHKTNDPMHNVFRLNPLEANKEYFRLLLLEEVPHYQPLRDAYRQVNQRIVVGGDWNNEYTIIANSLNP